MHFDPPFSENVHSILNFFSEKNFPLGELEIL